MKIIEIYKKYNIPPNLQQHMFRVASFAKLIVDNFKDPNDIESEIIVSSCLLHDLGNIIKFDFDNSPELLGVEQKNIGYWREVRNAMIKGYGEDEDMATVKMVRDLGVSKDVLFIVENWGFKNFTSIANSNNWNWKIAVYADHRISPSGVVSLRQNLENKQKRYRLNRPHSSHLSDQANSLFNSSLLVEKEIAKNVSIDLQSIETAQVEGLIAVVMDQDI